jgi:hypothetical protein
MDHGSPLFLAFVLRYWVGAECSGSPLPRGDQMAHEVAVDDGHICAPSAAFKIQDSKFKIQNSNALTGFDLAWPGLPGAWYLPNSPAQPSPAQ